MAKAKILLIEDDTYHAEIITEVLKEGNIDQKIQLVTDGRQAIDFFQKLDSRREKEIQSEIDVIILDLNLPKVHGMYVLKFLKKNPKFLLIPVIILSTSSDQETIDEAYRCGADDYITKPIAYDEFVEKIKKLKETCIWKTKHK